MPAFLKEIVWILAILGIAGLIIWGIQQVPFNDIIKKIMVAVVIVGAGIWAILHLVVLVNSF